MDSDELLDAFLFQQLHHQPVTHSESANLDAISSWLNLDDAYTPAIPSELQDLENHLLHFDTNDSHSFCSLSGPDSSLFLQDLENHLLHFDTNDSHSFCSLSGPDSSLFLQDFNLNSSSFASFESIFNGPSTTCQQPVLDEYNSFISEPELCLITPSVIPETTTIANQMYSHDHTSTSQMLTPAALAITEENEMKYETGNGVDVDDQDDETDEDKKLNCAALNSKNLVSERNRRKRLSQQLLALRALVPNITKMDKRSVLVDALAYLKSILEETARIQKELKEQIPTARLISNLRESCTDNPAGTLRIPHPLASCLISKSNKTQITEVDVEKMEERRFVVKITCKSGHGACGDILRVIESMGLEIAYASLQQVQPREIVSIIIMRAKKQGRMTEEKLKDKITSIALRSGLTFLNP